MIEKYLDAFPYSQFVIAHNDRHAFFLKEDGNEKALMLLDTDDQFEMAKRVSSEDFSKRSFSYVRWIPESRILYFMSDENNRENFNLYSLHVDTGNVKRITDTSYCGVYGINDAGTFFVYGDRYKTDQGKFWTKIKTLNLKNGEEREIVDDADWDYRFSWSGISFNSDETKVYARVDKGNKRQKTNLVEIDLATGAWRKLLEEKEECSQIYSLIKEVRDNSLYYVSDILGFENIFHLNVQTGQVTELTYYQTDNNGIASFNEYGVIGVNLSFRGEDRTEIQVLSLDPTGVDVISYEKIDGAHSLIDCRERMWLSRSLLSSPTKLLAFDQDLKLQKTQAFYKGEEDELGHNSYRFVNYRTFDNKKVPCFLSMPKGEVKGAVIQAFYGGENRYRWLTQLFAELGIAFLSPAVRGSWAYGKEWRELIKGDLGGDEILDLVWGARFLESELGLPANKIGLEGGSHGGYSVLRALTLPKNFKGQDSYYPFGFGICWAGFADLEDFYHTSNIPDWLVGMLGPYEENKSLYKERSPLHSFDNLAAPLFISHGTNDARVSPTSMQGFLDKLRASDKKYEIYLSKGIGHSEGTRDDKVAEYSKMVSFLQKHVLTP
jgi:dipeptidyl aminopeptidase/acylaminoacyl peptidase